MKRRLQLDTLCPCLSDAKIPLLEPTAALSSPSVQMKAGLLRSLVLLTMLFSFSPS